LSIQTGRKAIELARAKGKASENKSWSEVVKDSEILSTEEQLGLSKEQIQQLKDKSLSKEERMEVAVLLLNETYTFEEVLSFTLYQVMNHRFKKHDQEYRRSEYQWEKSKR
jgi:hypothetical protein